MKLNIILAMLLALCGVAPAGCGVDKQVIKASLADSLDGVKAGAMCVLECPETPAEAKKACEHACYIKHGFEIAEAVTPLIIEAATQGAAVEVDVEGIPVKEAPPASPPPDVVPE